MSQFVNRLIVNPLDDGENWKLIFPLRYQDDSLGLIVVPPGFVTDGGSVPPLFRNIVSPTGKGFRAFIIHDWLYGTQTVTKDQADECLFGALKVCNLNIVADEIIYKAVADAGVYAWEDDKKNIAANLALVSQGGIHDHPMDQ